MRVRLGVQPQTFFAPDGAGGTAVADPATDKAAPDAAAAQAATDQAAADKVVAGKTAADAAAAAAPAGKTPEQIAADAATAAKPGTVDASAKPPEKYALTLPENSLLRDGDLAYAEQEAKALGLSQEQASALVTQRDTALKAVAAQFEADTKADPILGGANFDRSVQLAEKGLQTAMTKAGSSAEEIAFIGDALNRTGWGNHKALIRLFAWIGKATTEDTPNSPNAPTQTTSKSPADVLYGTTAT